MIDSQKVLRGLCRFTQKVPPIRGVGRLQCRLASYYRENWSHGRTWVQIENVWVHLDPREAVDSALLFTFQWVDMNEHQALREILRPGDCFVDVGANVGWYSLRASSYVGSQGHVIAVEANPEMAGVIESNLRANGINNVELFNLGVSDTYEPMNLWINTNGNVGRSTLLQMGEDEQFCRAVEVDCKPLADLIDQPVRMMKMDIEGLEYTVLRDYLTRSEWYPDFVLIEQWDYPTDESNAVDLLIHNGYELVNRWDHNFLLANRK